MLNKNNKKKTLENHSMLQ